MYRCFHLIQFLCLVATASLAGWNIVLAVEDSRDATSIEVYPRSVTVSDYYPAKWIALQQLSDGSSVDRTEDLLRETAKHLVPGLAIDALGNLTVNSQVFQSPDPSRAKIPFTIELDSQSISLEITVRSEKSARPSFPREVSAVLGKAGCNLGTCHGNLHGKGGFRLSLRGDDPAFDFASIVRGNSGRRIDMFTPDASLLLAKPTGKLHIRVACA